MRRTALLGRPRESSGIYMCYNFFRPPERQLRCNYHILSCEKKSELMVSQFKAAEARAQKAINNIPVEH